MTLDIPPARLQTKTTPVVILKEKHSDFYGVPKFALWIIIVNLAAWGVGFSLLYLASGNPPAKLPVLIAGETIIIGFSLVAVFALWKLFWWVIGCSFSCLTALIFYAVIAVATGAIAVNFPKF